MRIYLYCILRNEARLLPYFLRHYTGFVDKLIFYDDQSDDGTRELITACPKAELRDWPGSHGIVDDEFLDFANKQWQQSIGHADWIIWVDSDEFIYHPNILGVLQCYLEEDVDLPRIQGFTMFSDHFPTTNGQIYDEIKTGLEDEVWSKPVVFRRHVKWNVGRHSIYLDGWSPKLSLNRDLKLLHYRCFGLDYVRERHARNWSRVPEHCRVKTFGQNTSPGYTKAYGLAWFEEKMRLLPVMQPVV